jgi:hypothetical protein
VQPEPPSFLLRERDELLLAQPPGLRPRAGRQLLRAGLLGLDRVEHLLRAEDLALRLLELELVQAELLRRARGLLLRERARVGDATQAAGDVERSALGVDRTYGLVLERVGRVGERALQLAGLALLVDEQLGQLATGDARIVVQVLLVSTARGSAGSGRRR